MPTWNEVGLAAGIALVLWQVARHGIPALMDYFASRWIALETGQTEMRRLLEELKDAVERQFAEMRQAHEVQQADERQYRAGLEKRLEWLEQRSERRRMLRGEPRPLPD
jgi:hypothetical protein